MKSRLYLIIGILAAIVYWFFESSIHYFVHGEATFELLPDDSNELWMRGIIVFLTLVIGHMVDRYADRVHEEKKRQEAQKIYNATLFATHHILNNLLNQMQLFKIEASRSKDFNKDILVYYDQAFDEAKALLEKLANVEKIDSQSIEDSVKPNA